jgi:hypothetical protein
LISPFSNVNFFIRLNFIQYISLPVKNDNLQKTTTTTKKVWCYFFVTLNFIKQICSDRIKINISHYKEIIVVDGFEVKNGMLGLDQDMYLSIAKFLDSSILREV